MFKSLLLTLAHCIILEYQVQISRWKNVRNVQKFFQSLSSEKQLSDRPTTWPTNWPDCMLAAWSPTNSKYQNINHYQTERETYIFSNKKEVYKQATHFWEGSGLRVWYVNCAEPLTTGLVEVQKITNKPGKKSRLSMMVRTINHGLCYHLKLRAKAHRNHSMLIKETRKLLKKGLMSTAV